MPSELVNLIQRTGSRPFPVVKRLPGMSQAKKQSYASAEQSIDSYRTASTLQRHLATK